ncbi:hypothetical protein [Nocardioides sp.]|uniref:hypothetical protein n=1 Tax=Nocardioides sp. TaxID=35761 RepID=UPI00286B29E2|nr:hypothetical protein [Nocardioides sp.]
MSRGVRFSAECTGAPPGSSVHLDLTGGSIGILSGPDQQATARVEGPLQTDSELAIALYVRAD